MTDKFTIEDLFSYVCRYIASASSSNEITDTHKRYAILIFTEFQEYILDHWQGEDDEDDAWVDMKDLDFGDFVSKKLDELEQKTNESS